MSAKRKIVHNGRGTLLDLGNENYISFGPNGNDVMFRCNGVTIAFDKLEELLDAISFNKASYKNVDENAIRIYKAAIEGWNGDDIHNSNVIDCHIVFRGIKKPSVEEAYTFLKSVIKTTSGNQVASVTEISINEIPEKDRRLVDSLPLYGIVNPDNYHYCGVVLL